MKNLAKFALVAFIVTCFSACNTIAGAGKDIKQGGSAIENSAEDAKK